MTSSGEADAVLTSSDRSRVVGVPRWLLFASKAVHAAIGMAMMMIILGVFYIAQDADFLGIVQIFVYTGAVMMLFLFVLMLVGVDSSDSPGRDDQGSALGRPACSSIGLAGILLIAAIGQVTVGTPGRRRDQRRRAGNVIGLAELIFGSTSGSSRSPARC